MLPAIGSMNIAAVSYFLKASINLAVLLNSSVIVGATVSLGIPLH